MPTFITYTRDEYGCRETVFINVDFIASASYIDSKGELKLILSQTATSPPTSALLRGDEAQQALKVLRERS